MGSSLSEIINPGTEIIVSEGLLSGAGWSLNWSIPHCQGLMRRSFDLTYFQSDIIPLVLYLYLNCVPILIICPFNQG